MYSQVQKKNGSVRNYGKKLYISSNLTNFTRILKKIPENDSLRFGSVTIYCENCNLTRIQENVTSFKNQTLNRLRNKSNFSREFNRSVNGSLEVNNFTLRVRAKFSNGKQEGIKIMPEVAAKKALRALKLHECSNNCSIVLKEVGSGNSTKLAYQMNANVTARVFGLFRARAKVQTQIDSQTGQVILKKRPWWSFLASWKN